MPLLPYSFVRTFLFGLDPETAHDLTVGLLARRSLGFLWRQAMVEDLITLAGLRFPNRVGLAAGIDKNARCLDALSGMGFGFAEVGTVTPLPQPGNPGPRMFRLPGAQAIINRMGFNSAGLDAFVHNVQCARFRQSHRRAPMLLGLNIGKNAATAIDGAQQDYLKGLERVYPYADYVAINISSPNTKNLRSLQSDVALDGLLGAIAERRAQLAQAHGKQVPVFVKIAPDLGEEQLDAIARTLMRHEMDGVIATNTTTQRHAVQGLPHADEAGGLSGAPLLEASNKVIAQLRARLGPRYPIIGVGGIMSAQDAVAKIRAGADVVQICTGMVYQGPQLIADAARAIAQAFGQKAEG